MRDDTVAVIRVETRPHPAMARVSGEHLRRLFEQRLDDRDPEELAEPEAA
jgi:hypothetical protein